jgi:putative intracellular protease/amidase
MEQQTVHFFVLDTLADWEPGFALAGINKGWQAGPGRYHVKTVALSSESVTSMGGVRILPDITLNELEPSQSALLILPGSDVWSQEKYFKAAEKVKEFLAAGVPVAAICGAVAALARAGILDNKKHTGNIVDELKATGSYRGEALYQDVPAFTDGKLITAGATAPVDFAYQIFKKLEVAPPGMLEAWHGLFKTGDPAYFFALMQAAGSNG